MFGWDWRSKFQRSQETLRIDRDGLTRDAKGCHERLGRLLSIEVKLEERDRPELQANGTLVLPADLCAEVHQSRRLTHPQTSAQVVIAKVVYRQFRNFDHAIFRGGRTRIAALMGSDESGQFWQHFLPDEYMDMSLNLCERYLLQARPDDDIVTA